MARLAGIVQLRHHDGSLGDPVINADLTIRSTTRSSREFTIQTNASGRYAIELIDDDYVVAVDDSNAGSSQRWQPITIEEENQVLNLFLPDAQSQLQTLISSFPGEMGFYALNLQSGQEIAINADNSMYLASVSKIALGVGCVDLMRDASEADDPITLALRHYREEGKALKYQHIGQTLPVRALMEHMMTRSDTTATDTLCEHYGLNRINIRLSGLDIEGIRPLSSMILLDRQRWALEDRRAPFLTEYAFSVYRRHRITSALNELNEDLPRFPSDALWDTYLSQRKDQATARAFGTLLKKMADKTLLDTPWKNQLLLDTLLYPGDRTLNRNRRRGRFSGILSSGSGFYIDSKGGSHRDVRNQAGLIRHQRTDEPVAVLVAFTQRNELAQDRDADDIIRTAGDLALQALGIDAELIQQSVRQPNSIVFQQPRPGQAFNRGDTPFIRWDSRGISGPLTLSLTGPGSTQVITRSGINDGEWHSFTLPATLPPSSQYQFVLSGTDGSGNTVSATSPFFTVGGTLQVLRPSAGEPLVPGSKPIIRWDSHGVRGRLRIRLLRNNRAIETISSRAVNDGEWHSWTVPDDLTPGSGYQIEISSVNDNRIIDRSAPFVIGGSIEIISPASDDILDIGSHPQIRWRSHNVKGPLALYLLGDDEMPVETIASNAIDDGEWHSWTVPDVKAGIGYRIAISDKGAPGVKATSDFFQIGTRFEWLNPSARQKTFANWGDQAQPAYFPHGTKPGLLWRRIGPLSDQPLTLELLHDGERVQTISRHVRDDGEWHSWSADEMFGASSRYQFRLSIRDQADTAVLSPFFSIGQCIYAHLDNPREGSLSAGITPRIQWKSENVRGTLTLDLLDRAGNRVQRISSRAIDDSLWSSWQIPNTLTSGRYYRIRIRSNDNPDVFGYTEWFRFQ